MSEKQSQGRDWSEQLARLLGMKPQHANMVKILVLLLALGILFMNAGALFGLETGGNQRPPAATEVAAPPGAPQDELARMEADLARNLEQSLSRIEGAGAVHVSVMLAAGPTVLPVTDTRVDKSTTRETAADKSTRETITTNTTHTNVTTKAGNADALAVMKKSRAQIAGVLIVAEGAARASVRARIHQAAVTALGIAANRVDVIAAQRR